MLSSILLRPFLVMMFGRVGYGCTCLARGLGVSLMTFVYTPSLRAERGNRVNDGDWFLFILLCLIGSIFVTISTRGSFTRRNSMQCVEKTISVAELHRMAGKMFNHLVKAVVDIHRGIMVVDAELHADQESFLLDTGSEQAHVWGINLHPDKFGSSEFIEFDSMINLRPSWGNMSRGVDDSAIQAKIREIVNRLVVP